MRCGRTVDAAPVRQLRVHDLLRVGRARHAVNRADGVDGALVERVQGRDAAQDVVEARRRRAGPPPRPTPSRRRAPRARRRRAPPRGRWARDSRPRPRARMTTTSRPPSEANIPPCSMRTTARVGVAPTDQVTSSMRREKPPDTVTARSIVTGAPTWPASHSVSRRSRSGSTAGGVSSGLGGVAGEDGQQGRGRRDVLVEPGQAAGEHCVDERLGHRAARDEAGLSSYVVGQQPTRSVEHRVGVGVRQGREVGPRRTTRTSSASTVARSWVGSAGRPAA